VAPRYRFALRCLIASEPRLIVEVPHGSPVEGQLRREPPPSVVFGAVVVEAGPTDDAGNLEAPGAGEVVLSVPSPETLVREAAEVRRVIAGAGTGIEPLVVVVEAAEELREDELAVVLDAAAHSSRPVLLRVIGNA
jgi:hypothetical protein